MSAEIKRAGNPPQSQKYVFVGGKILIVGDEGLEAPYLNYKTDVDYIRVVPASLLDSPLYFNGRGIKFSTRSSVI